MTETNYKAAVSVWRGSAQAVSGRNKKNKGQIPVALRYIGSQDQDQDQDQDERWEMQDGKSRIRMDNARWKMEDQDQDRDQDERWKMKNRGSRWKMEGGGWRIRIRIGIGIRIGMEDGG